MTPQKTFISVFAAIICAAVLIYGIQQIRTHLSEQAKLRSIKAEMVAAHNELLRELDLKVSDRAFTSNGRARLELINIALESRTEAAKTINKLRDENASKEEIAAAQNFYKRLDEIIKKLKQNKPEY